MDFVSLRVSGWASTSNATASAWPQYFTFPANCLNNATSNGYSRPQTFKFRTFLVESYGEGKGRVSCHVGHEDAGVTPLQELHDAEGLAGRTVLAGKVQGSVPFPVRTVSLQQQTSLIRTSHMCCVSSIQWLWDSPQHHWTAASPQCLICCAMQQNGVPCS